MTQFRENKKLKIFIQANCQSHALRNIFQKVDRLNEKYEIMDVKPVHLWKDEDLDEIITKVKECDIFLHQPIFEKNFGQFASNYLKSHLSQNAFSISFPNLYFTGYHPQAFYLKDNTGKNIDGPFDYHDKNILDAYKYGKTVSDVEKIFLDEKYYTTCEIEKKIDESLKDLENREMYTDIKMSPVIRNRMNGKKLFHIFNHPSNDMISILVNKIMERLNDEFLTYNEMQKYSKEMLGQIQVPIYKSIQKYYNIEEEYKMIFFEKEYSLKEYIDMYFNFYSSIDTMQLKPFSNKNPQAQKLFKNDLNQSDTDKFKYIVQTDLQINEFYSIQSEVPLKIDPPKHNYDHYIFKTIIFERPTAKIYSFNDVYLSIDFSKPYCTDYYLFDNDKKPILGFSNGNNPFLLNSIEYVDDSIGFIDDKFTKFNVCHFILDKLTRVEELSKSDVSSFILFSQNNYTSYISDLLHINFFDFDKYKSRIVNGKITFKFTKVNISTSSSNMFRHPGQNINSNAKNIIEKIKSTILPSQKKYKIYIDRSEAQTRQVINNQEIKNYLLGESFIIVQLENLTVNEQFKLFKNAVCVIGVHGAGLTNIAFCNPGTKIIEILPPLCATPAFWKLANAMDLEYDTVLGIDPDISVPDYKIWKHDPAQFNRRDLVIPLSDLQKKL